MSRGVFDDDDPGRPERRFNFYGYDAWRAGDSDPALDIPNAEPVQPPRQRRRDAE